MGKRTIQVGDFVTITAALTVFTGRVGEVLCVHSQDDILLGIDHSGGYDESVYAAWELELHEYGEDEEDAEPPA